MNESMKKELEEYGVDVKGVLNRFMNNEALFTKFILKFVDDKNFDSLKKAVLDKDYSEIEMYAHTLKGVSANLGIEPIYNISTKIVELVRSNNTEPIGNMVNELEQKYKDFIAIVKKHN